MANNEYKSRLLWIIGWSVILLGFYPVLGGSDWQIDSFVHTLFESSATIIALIIAVLLLVGYYSDRNPRLLFFGVGFLGTAILDANHALATSHWLADHSSDQPGLSPDWSWNSSRLFLSLLLFLSCWQNIAGAIIGKRRNIPEKRIYLILGTLTAVILLFFALYRLPNPYLQGFGVGRPIEVPPAIFFLAALIIHLRQGGWKSDKFEYWMVLFLVSSFIYQALYMPSSQELFDSLFISAHLLKIISYLFVFIGLTANIYGQFKASKADSANINIANLELQKEISEKSALSERMKSTAMSLEEKVRERTKDLEDARLAALNMMEDANEAKKAAEDAKEELDIQANKLSRSNKELEQFAYVASHDLQEPLRTVGSFVQLMAQRYQGKLDGQADEYIQFIVDGVTRMRQLINDLLMFSRVETKGGEIAATDCEFVMAEVLSNLKAAIDSSHAEIIHDQMPMIMVDRVQLSQVFQNLIGNALKFKGEKNPKIEIRVKKQDGAWLFSVQDNGIGFDPEYSEKIFIIFQRLHTRNEYPGTGIGLSLCKKIIERHGGKIWVDSAPGRGSTFKFTIPDNMGELYEHSSFDQANRNTVG